MFNFPQLLCSDCECPAGPSAAGPGARGPRAGKRKDEDAPRDRSRRLPWPWRAFWLVAACGSSSGGSGGSGERWRRQRRRSICRSWPTPRSTPASASPAATSGSSIVEPTAIDPYNSQESEGHARHQERLRHPGHRRRRRATSRSCWRRATARTPTCTDWTFILKPNQKFSNGEAVDAESIKRGMTRAALGTAASAVAYHMAERQGLRRAAGQQGDRPDEGRLHRRHRHRRHAEDRADRAGLRVRPEDGAAGVQPGAAGGRCRDEHQVQRRCRSATGRS